jgi:hypothetical protein
MISSFKQNEVVLQHNGLCFLQDSIFTSDAIEKTTILFSRIDLLPLAYPSLACACS